MMPYPCRYFSGLQSGAPQGTSYQLVLASDAQTTYAMFNYINVDVRYQIPSVFMGYTDSNGRCLGSSLGGSNSMNHFELAKTNTGDAKRWFYPMFDNLTIPAPTAEEQCLAWTTTTVDLGDADIDPCPCSGKQAALDPRFNVEYVDWFRYCFTDNRLQKFANGVQSSLRFKQVCCYDPLNNGSLITSPPLAGFPRITQGAAINDSQAYNWCCSDSSRYCSLFFALRPISTCNAYTAPIQALLWGDPHFITLDGLDFTFNGIGEYTMIQTEDGQFTLQARTSQMINTQGALVQATAFVAFAAHEQGAATVQVELSTDRQGLVLYVNGQRITSAKFNHVIDDTVINSNGVVANITFPSGFGMSVSISMRMLSIQNVVPLTFLYKTRGLLGTYNANPSDDLTRPDGTILFSGSSMSDIHYKFGQLWQITAADSLFVYSAGKTAADYINVAFVPAFEPPCYTQADITMGQGICAGNTNCYYDYCVTKDPAIAIATRNIEAQYKANQLLLQQAAPQLSIRGLTASSSGSYVINATIGSPVSFTLTATSSQNVRIMYAMAGNISMQLQVSLNTNTGLFQWTPENYDPVDLSFVALDSNNGVSAKLQVVVTLCSGCGAATLKGKCNFASYTPLGTGIIYRLADCSCTTGWAGDNCMTNFNGCASSPCAVNSCRDLTPAQQQATGQLFTCSACPQGYYTNQCIDINECADNTSQCQQTCINTVGSYRCACTPGFRLNGLYNCVDIDECAEGTSTCDVTQTCTNTIGSFTCKCQNGFQPSNTISTTCVPITSCPSNYGCTYDCSVINGNPTCACPQGYTLGSDGKTCQDINECASTTTNKCSVPSSCQNTDGGYTCGGCAAGYSIGPDKRTCQVCANGLWGVNCANACDCGDNVLTCDKATGCSACKPGWTGAPLCTTDINECATPATAQCAQNEFCQNLPGTYVCLCQTGFTRDATTQLCTDVNECLLTPAVCSQTCTNTVGSYQCSCLPGYKLDGTQNCIDVDECVANGASCAQSCTNIPGSYQCTCLPGYTFISNSYCAPNANIVRFRLRINMGWNVLLSNSQSQMTINLQSALQAQLQKAFPSFPAYKALNIFNFSSGSVVFDTVLESNVALDSSDQSNAANDLTSYIKNNGGALYTSTSPSTASSAQVIDIPAIYVNGTTVPIQTACSVYNALAVCVNGGSCAVSSTNAPVCQCTEWYSGVHCEYNRQPLVIGLSVMGAVLLILIIVLVLLCCRRHAQRKACRQGAYREATSECSTDDQSMYKPGGDSMKSKLTPQWASDYTTNLYHYHDNLTATSADATSIGSGKA